MLKYSELLRIRNKWKIYVKHTPIYLYKLAPDRYISHLSKACGWKLLCSVIRTVAKIWQICFNVGQYGFLNLLSKSNLFFMTLLLVSPVGLWNSRLMGPVFFLSDDTLQHIVNAAHIQMICGRGHKGRVLLLSLTHSPGLICT